MEERHRRIAKIALDAAGGYSLALAGGYAVRAHNMGNRASADVDLFADWARRAEFSAVVETVVAALEKAGYAVTVATQYETFARLLLVPDGENEGEPEKLELSADWRAHAPVTMEIGPVLHPDDAVANKMCALYGRAEARDFVDVDSAISSGRYSRERLLDLAANADRGFDLRLFAGALGRLPSITDAELAGYDIAPAEMAAMRQRFAHWRDELLGT